MTVPAPRTPLASCPNCGATLTQVDTTRRPDTCPWLCAPCNRGFWQAELTPAARACWDPATRCHLDPAVRDAARAEHDTLNPRK